MRCVEVQNELSAFMDGELGSERAEEVAAHLGLCHACVEEFRSLRELVRWASLIPEEEPPAYLRASILHAMSTLGPTPAERFWSVVRQITAPRPLVWATCACATAALAVALAGTRGPQPVVTGTRGAKMAGRTPAPAIQPSTLPVTPDPPPVVIQPLPNPIATAPPPVAHPASDRPMELAERPLTPAVKPAVARSGAAPRIVPVVEPRVEAPPVQPEAMASPVTQPRGAEPTPPAGVDGTPGMMSLGSPSGDPSGGPSPGEGMAMMADKPAGTGGGTIVPDDDGLAETRQFFEDLKRGQKPPTDPPGTNPAPGGTRRPL
jgi:hypothetical protein